MKRTLTVSFILLVTLLLTASCARNKVVTVKANRQVVDLVKTWDPKLSFYTSKKNPLKTLEGLRQKEIACFGPELAGNIQAFYNAAGIRKEYGDAVQVVGPGNPIFLIENGPRLYLTNSNYEPKLKEAVKVRFSD